MAKLDLNTPVHFVSNISRLNPATGEITPIEFNGVIDFGEPTEEHKRQAEAFNVTMEELRKGVTFTFVLKRPRVTFRWIPQTRSCRIKS